MNTSSTKRVLCFKARPTHFAPYGEVVFVNNRSPKANWVWHGLRDYVGLRRAIQINYCKTKTCN